MKRDLFILPASSLILALPGDEREMESGLIFNQLICEFESRHPCQKDCRFVDCRLPIGPTSNVQCPSVQRQRPKAKDQVPRPIGNR